MLNSTTPASLLLAVLMSSLTGCSALKPGSEPREVFEKSDWTHAPSWANGAVRQDWWKDYDSTALTEDIETALANNPDLAAMAAKLEQAAAVEKQARAASYPKINLGFGAREGRRLEPDFGPYDLQPFTTSANLSWEADLTGKLRAATRSALEAKNAAFWDLRAAKLRVSTKVAESHFRAARLSQEKALMQQASSSHKKTLAILKARQRSGLISETQVQQHLARQGTFDRALLDLQRLHALTILQLATLKGQTAQTTSPTLLPTASVSLQFSTTSDILRQRPDLLAAEARVRSAFQIEEATRLNLLPSFRLNASTFAGTNSLTNRFRIWTAQIGPSLDLPIYDPVRLGALDSRRAQTKEASANYRSAVLKAFEETESTFLNFKNRQSQLSQAKAEVSAIKLADQNIQSSYQAGMVSNLEILESERRILQARKVELSLQQQLFSDHLSVIAALGGAYSD